MGWSVSRCETGCRGLRREFAIIVLNGAGKTTGMMDPMLNIPKNLKRKNPWVLIVMMGIAAISFLLAANAFVSVAAVMALPPAGFSG